MADSGAGLPDEPVQVVDLTESKECCVEGDKSKTSSTPVSGEGDAEHKPAKLIRKLSGVQDLEDEAKAMLSKIAESLGLDVMNRVSEKMSKKTRDRDSSARDERSRLGSARDRISSTIDQLCNKGASNESNLVMNQLTETLKGFAKLSSESSFAVDQFMKTFEKVGRKQTLGRREREQFQSVSSNTEDSRRIRSYSDSTSSASRILRSSRSRHHSDLARSNASRTTTSTCTGSNDEKSRHKRSSTSNRRSSSNGKLYGPYWLPLRQGKSNRKRESESTTAGSTEGTTSVYASDFGGSVSSRETIVPRNTLGLRPRKVTDLSEGEYENFLRSINEVPLVVLSKVFEKLDTRDSTRTEEDLFCEFLKVRLSELESKEKRKLIYKIHQLLDVPLD